jgi:hypothetical protein
MKLIAGKGQGLGEGVGAFHKYITKCRSWLLLDFLHKIESRK